MTAPVLARTLNLDGLDDGLPDTHLDCGTSTYSRLLRSLDLDPRILGDNFGYSYAPAPDIWPFEAMRTSHRTHEEAILSWFGISGNTVQHTGTEQAWQRVRSVLDDGRPAVVSVDMHEWPRSTFRNVLHYPHRVLIAGYRPGEALVVDGRGGKRFVQWMSTDEIDPAMASDGLRPSEPGGFDGRYITLDLPRPDPGRAVPAPGRYVQALADATRRYLRPEGTGHELGAPASREGWRAMQEFLRDLDRYLQDRTDLPRDRVVPGMTFFGTLAGQRLFNTLFIERAAEQTGLDLARCAAAFRTAAAYWRKYYLQYLFGFHAGRDMAALLRRLVPRVTVLVDGERRAIRLLDESLRSADIR
jgi:Butirosin biosynthesis protein H, N-terminal